MTPVVRDERVAEYVRSFAWRAAQGRLVRRWVNVIEGKAPSREAAVALTAVLLVELSVRSRAARALEWLWRWALLSFHIAAGRQATVGPLQLRDGVWSRPEAVRLGLDLLLKQPAPAMDMDRLAERWNGRVEGGAPSPAYVAALEAAMPFAERLVEATASSKPGFGAGKGTR